MALTQTLGSFLHILQEIMQKIFKINNTLKKPKENLQILNGSNTDSRDFCHRSLGTMKSLLKTVKSLKNPKENVHMFNDPNASSGDFLKKFSENMW